MFCISILYVQKLLIFYNKIHFTKLLSIILKPRYLLSQDYKHYPKQGWQPQEIIQSSVLVSTRSFAQEWACLGRLIDVLASAYLRYTDETINGRVVEYCTLIFQFSYVQIYNVCLILLQIIAPISYFLPVEQTCAV